MPTEVYSIRLDGRIHKMMDEMNDVNWQAEIRQAVEKLVREKKKQRLLAEAQELWKQQVPSEISAAEMIREDRDAR
jgi:hypothetical protein